MIISQDRRLPEPPPWKRRLYLPTYALVEAAKYAETSPNTIAYWFYGGGSLGPTLPGKEHRKPISYLQLVEVAFVATFRSLGVSLQNIRKTREYAAQHLNSEFPFAQYQWQTDGANMLLDLKEVEREVELGRLIVGNKYGQMQWRPLIADRFKQFDYEDELAVTWHLKGRKYPVIIDPRIAFGAPTIKGLPTWVLKGRWTAGETIEEMREDFQRLEPKDIEFALEFEGIDLVTVS